MTLMTHSGGWDAAPADLAAVPVPDSTESYVPVPYPRLIEEVKLHIPRFGLRLHEERYALAREGNQMFGVLSCTNGHVDDWCLAIGLRSSYDRSIAVQLTAGSHVFVCDNLAFHGEATVTRKHTPNVFRDLPDRIYSMLSRVSAMNARIAQEIDHWKTTPLDRQLADHLIVESVRRNVLPASRIPKVLGPYSFGQEGCTPDPRPLTAWALLNAFTLAMKSRAPSDQMDGTLRLTQLFREVLAPSP